MVELTKSNNEQIVAEASAGFDIDKALNTTGFAAFLAEYHDAETVDMKNGAEVEKRLEVFGAMEKVKTEMRSIFSAEIQKDMGLSLGPQELAAVDKHIMEIAIRDTGEFLKLNDRIKKFRELPIQNSAYEDQIASIGKSADLKILLEEKRATRETVGTARKYSGFGGTARYGFMHLKMAFKGMINIEETLMSKFSEGYNPGNDYKQFTAEWDQFQKDRAAVNSYQEKYENVGLDSRKMDNILTSVDGDIKEIENLLESMTNLEELKKSVGTSFDALKKELVGGVAQISEVREAIQNYAADQLLKMVNSDSFETRKEAQKLLEKWGAASGTTETGIDPLGKINAVEYQGKIDKAIQNRASEIMMEKVLAADLGTNPLTKMEKVLEPFLAEEKLGSLGTKETKEFIAKSIKEVAGNLGTENANKIKKMMLARILAKIQN